jgi:hypothetical protein
MGSSSHVLVQPSMVIAAVFGYRSSPVPMQNCQKTRDKTKKTEIPPTREPIVHDHSARAMDSQKAFNTNNKTSRHGKIKSRWTNIAEKMIGLPPFETQRGRNSVGSCRCTDVSARDFARPAPFGRRTPHDSNRGCRGE